MSGSICAINSNNPESCLGVPTLKPIMSSLALFNDCNTAIRFSPSREFQDAKIL